MKKKTANKFDFKTIKSFEDACKKTGDDPNKLPGTDMLRAIFAKPIIAIYKLMVITEAINDGYIPDMADIKKYKYYPWHYITKDGSSPSGFRFSHSYYGYANSTTHLGAFLCTDTSEKAVYIASQFTKEWEDFKLAITK